MNCHPTAAAAAGKTTPPLPPPGAAAGLGLPPGLPPGGPHPPGPPVGMPPGLFPGGPVGLQQMTQLLQSQLASAGGNPAQLQHFMQQQQTLAAAQHQVIENT